MGILDFLRRKKQVDNKTESKPEEDLPKVVINDEKVNLILEEEIKDFFPDTGVWYSDCFGRASEVSYGNLPCHLRDNAWMSRLLYSVVNNKGYHVNIPLYTIKKFIDNSEEFANLRHEYELRIVKWQIDRMRNGGEGWLIPKGYDDVSIMFSPDAVEIFRGGVVRTLTAIGMDSEVVEEGIEKNADMFREQYIQAGFRNEFEPMLYLHGSPDPADEEHKRNWLKAKRYAYYCKHKQSVDKYGEPHPDMLITSEEVKYLYDVLPAQNAARRKVIEEWRTSALDGFYDKLNKKTSNTTSQEEDAL